MHPADQQQELQEQQNRDQRHSQNQQQAGDLARQEMREMMKNPEVIRELSDADHSQGGQSDKSWLPELTEEHLNRDQVYSVHDDRDLWERRWLNQNTADMTMMTYPRPESRTPHERVRKVRNRMRGDSKRPLTADERRKIRAKFEQKTDREKRSKDGKFMELMLSQVVESRQKTKGGDGSESFWEQLLG